MVKVFLCALLTFFLVRTGSLPAYAVNSTSLRCEGKLVSLGESRRRVEDICGQPSYVHISQLERTVKEYQKSNAADQRKGKIRQEQGQYHHKHDLDKDYDFVREIAELVDIEVWTYNFGPSRFTQMLRFENDRLCSIEAGTYGYGKSVTNAPHLVLGESKAIVMMKYGKPTDTYKRPASELIESYDEQKDMLRINTVKKPIDHEEWVYDFGPDRFQEMLTFKADQLVKIEKMKKRGTKK